MRALGIGEGTSRAKGAGVEYTIAALQAAQVSLLLLSCDVG